MSLCFRIKSAIASSHQLIESTPIAQAMVNGDVTRSDYLYLLTRLMDIHADFEQYCDALTPYFSPATISSFHRTAAISRDIKALCDSCSFVVQKTSPLHEKFCAWLEVSPWMILGTTYVLEGSRMGSMYIARSLSKTFEVPMEMGHGLDYHLDGVTTRRQDWEQFRAQLDALPLNDRQQPEVIFAALDTMKVIHNIYAGVRTEQLLRA